MEKMLCQLKKFEDAELWAYHIEISSDIAKKFIEGKNKRVLCSINNSAAFQCAIMQAANDYFFININKEIRKRLNLSDKEDFEVSLKKDKSEFGLPFPEEFKEVLDTDIDSKSYFDALTPGKKRNLLYIVNKVKSTQKRIEKSLIIAEHLKIFEGVIDFKALNESFKKGL